MNMNLDSADVLVSGHKNDMYT